MIDNISLQLFLIIWILYILALWGNYNYFHRWDRIGDMYYYDYITRDKRIRNDVIAITLLFAPYLICFTVGLFMD
mgnify:CR=1 FL=1